MRVTLKIDDDVHARLKERAKREGRTMGRVLSDTVRAQLLSTEQGKRLLEAASKTIRNKKAIT